MIDAIPKGINAGGFVGDVAKEETIQHLLAETLKTYGKVNILCSNAGVAAGGITWERTTKDWEWVMGVNFYGVLYGLQTFVPHMLAHGEPGHIVNTASVAALMPGGDTYGVSKHGVLVISEALHRDLRAAGSAVGASVLCPGWVDTKIAEAERNRPTAMTSAKNPEGHGLPLGDTLKQGMPPEVVAEKVLNSIREERFYILPHAGWDEVVLGRVDAIVARGAPYELDREALVAKRGLGEEV